MEAEWGAYIGIGLDARLTADYDAETSFSDVDARDECDRAKVFLNRIRDLLLTNGSQLKNFAQRFWQAKLAARISIPTV